MLKSYTIYHNNASPLEKNSLFLLDFGLKWGLQVSDCSRTLPVNGRFNPLQALLLYYRSRHTRGCFHAAKAGISLMDLNDTLLENHGQLT